jgi:hypothetical protein
MRNRGSRQNFEGWLRKKTAPARAEADTSGSTAASASTGTAEATLMIPPSLLARADQVIE